MMYFTNLSLRVTADERCTHFHRHKINFEFNTDPIDADNTNNNNDNDFDNTIRREWLTQASMPMQVHFDTP